MQNNYILANKNNEIMSFYYGKERAIYCEKIKEDNYSMPIKIIENVLDCFSVNITPNKEIYIFCQDYEGEIILCKVEDNKIVKKSLFVNKDKSLKNTLFYPIFFKNNISLIYNTKGENENNFLTIKTFINGEKWTNSENIDTFYVLQNNIFDIQKIDENHIIVAYQKKSNDIQIGYKEIKDFNISNFITIHKTAYQMIDYSFIVFRQEIHYLYIIKTLFSSQVIYRRKGANGLESPVIIFDGQRVKDCIINIIDNNLYCSFISNNTLFYCKSEDFGRTFSNVIRYEKPIARDVIKAKFLSFNNIDRCSINHIYVDSKNHLNIYMLAELLPSVFNKNIYKKEETYYMENNKQNKFITSLNNQFVESKKNDIIERDNKNNEQYIQKNNNYQKTQYLQNDFMSNFNLEEFSQFNKINDNKENTLNTQNNKENNANINDLNKQTDLILENRLKMLSQEVNEKNSQILKLNELIQNKNKQQVDIEINLRQKIKDKEDENKKLLEKIANLEEEMKKNDSIDNVDEKDEKVEKNEEIKDNEENVPISKEEYKQGE